MTKRERDLDHAYLIAAWNRRLAAAPAKDRTPGIPDVAEVAGVCWRCGRPAIGGACLDHAAPANDRETLEATVLHALRGAWPRPPKGVVNREVALDAARAKAVTDALLALGRARPAPEDHDG